MDVIDWLMKPGGQNVLVEIVCSTKECNIRTQQKSTDSRAAYMHTQLFFCWLLGRHGTTREGEEKKYLQERFEI